MLLEAFFSAKLEVQ